MGHALEAASVPKCRRLPAPFPSFAWGLVAFEQTVYRTAVGSAGCKGDLSRGGCFGRTWAPGWPMGTATQWAYTAVHPEVMMVCVRRFPSHFAGPWGRAWGSLCLLWVASSCVPDVPFPDRDTDAGAVSQEAQDSISGASKAEAAAPAAMGGDPEQAVAQAGPGSEPAGMSDASTGGTDPETPGQGDGGQGPMTVPCEADLLTDVNHCGACGRACPQEYPRCEDGDCRAAPAPACGGADLDNDPDNCGLCAWACNGSEACEGGKCVLKCDADLATDASNCGACGLKCEAGRECREGECRAIEVAGVECPGDQEVCGMGCIPKSACCDDLSCRVDDVSKPYCDKGVCIECKLASDCDSDELCEAGQCVPKPVPCGGECGSAEQCIDDQCVCPGRPDLSTDRNNCGTCGNSCRLSQECVDGTCQAYCGGANILSDARNCGETCERCDSDELCVLGACTVCGDVRTDENNCGECGKRCDSGEECLRGECTRKAQCGDGLVEGLEACDPGMGTGVGTLTCSSACQVRELFQPCQDDADCNTPPGHCISSRCYPVDCPTDIPRYQFFKSVGVPSVCGVACNSSNINGIACSPECPATVCLCQADPGPGPDGCVRGPN